MKKLLLSLFGVFVVVAFVATTAMATKPEEVTFCHAAGLAGTTKYVTLTLPYVAVYGQAGHFNENGTTQAGHEQDYLGACTQDEEETFVRAGVMFNDATCDTVASVTYSNTDNVSYEVTSGSVAAGQSVTITASAKGDNTLEGKSVFEYTFAAAPTGCVPPPPPHIVTGSASVICDNSQYVVSGEIDGFAADSVAPATIPGNTKGTVEVVVTRGDTSVRTLVTLNGDCAVATPVTTPAITPTTPAVVTPKPVVKPKPKAKPVAKPKAKPVAKPKPQAPKTKPNKAPQKAPYTL